MIRICRIRNSVVNSISLDKMHLTLNCPFSSSPSRHLSHDCYFASLVMFLELLEINDENKYNLNLKKEEVMLYWKSCLEKRLLLLKIYFWWASSLLEWTSDKIFPKEFGNKRPLYIFSSNCRASGRLRRPCCSANQSPGTRDTLVSLDLHQNPPVTYHKCYRFKPSINI